jgi:UDP-2,3-diacylglucosamine pyrophosphatase LpxH
MPTFCISDLHLCDRGPRDNFAYNGREERFYNFLKFVEESRGRLLILGDLLDWWQVPVGSAISAYLPLLDRLNGLGAEWIVGNHDNALAPLIGTPLMIDHPLFKRSAIPSTKPSAAGGLPFSTGTRPTPTAVT